MERMTVVMQDPDFCQDAEMDDCHRLTGSELCFWILMEITLPGDSSHNLFKPMR